MQQRPQMIPMMNSFPPTNITSEQIQKNLDENKKLILANIGQSKSWKTCRMCSDPRYEAQLQKNLMYLAAIADAQPQTPAIPPQMAPHPARQPGYYMQHPQAAAMAQQQQVVFFSKAPPQFGNPPTSYAGSSSSAAATATTGRARANGNEANARSCSWRRPSFKRPTWRKQAKRCFCAKLSCCG